MRLSAGWQVGSPWACIARYVCNGNRSSLVTGRAFGSLREHQTHSSAPILNGLQLLDHIASEPKRAAMASTSEWFMRIFFKCGQRQVLFTIRMHGLVVAKIRKMILQSLAYTMADLCTCS